MSADQSGMHRNTANKYLQTEQLPSELRKPHTWRTRADPFAEVWDELTGMLKDMPELQAKTLLDFLQHKYPGRYSDGQLRTLQRRVRHHRALNGTDQEVFFEQEHSPGEVIAFDWMDACGLVTINGESFDHKLMHCVLPYSNWEWATIALSESFLSLKVGLQTALFRLGGVPRVAASDNTSAATHRIESDKSSRMFNDAYKKLLKHFKLKGRRINLGCPNENGDVESLHGHLRRRLRQSLMLRGSCDFSSREEYETFLAEQLQQANSNRTKRVAEELNTLRELPCAALPAYEQTHLTIGGGSIARVKNQSYTVPSRLIGHQVCVRIFEQRLAFLVGRDCVYETQRVTDGISGIRYQHVIGSLVKKPGAFRRYRHREALFPSPLFRETYNVLDEAHNERQRDREYLQLLKLAADEGEQRVAGVLDACLQDRRVPTLAHLRSELGCVQSPPAMPALQPCLATYDALLSVGGA